MTKYLKHLWHGMPEDKRGNMPEWGNFETKL